MYYRRLMRDYPESQYIPEAMFAQGEYFFDMPNYDQATRFFKAYLEQAPETNLRLYALAYLLKMARLRDDAARVEQLKKSIIDQKQLGLVFSNSKEFTVRTPLANNFRAVFDIDRIEFYLEGDLFEKISY